MVASRPHGAKSAERQEHYRSAEPVGAARFTDEAGRPRRDAWAPASTRAWHASWQEPGFILLLLLDCRSRTAEGSRHRPCAIWARWFRHTTLHVSSGVATTEIHLSSSAVNLAMGSRSRWRSSAAARAAFCRSSSCTTKPSSTRGSRRSRLRRIRRATSPRPMTRRETSCGRTFPS